MNVRSEHEIMEPVNGEDVYVYRCSGINGLECIIKIRGQINALCVDDTHSATICADLVTDHVLLVNCRKVQVVIGGQLPNIIVENCIGLELVIGNQVGEPTLEAFQSSGIVVSMVTAEKIKQVPCSRCFYCNRFRRVCP